MAEAMEVDSVLSEHTNSDNMNSMETDASVLQENSIDEPASSSVLQENTIDEPASSSVLQENTIDKPASSLVLQEKTDKPASPLQQKTDKSPSPLQENTDKPASPLQEITEKPALPPLEKTDQPASPLQEITEKPAVPLQKTSDKPASPLQDKTNKPASLLQDTTNRPASPLLEKTDKPALPLQEKTDKPASSLQGKTNKPTSPLQEKTNRPASPLQEKTDKPASLLQEKTNEPASPLLEKTDKPASLLQEKTNEPASSLLEKTGKPALPLQEKTNKPASPLLEKTDKPASPLQEKTNKPASPMQEKTGKPVSLLQKKIDKLASPLQGKTNKPALSLLEETDKSASPLQEKTNKPASPLQEKADKPASPLQEKIVNIASPLQEKTNKPASPLQEKTDKPASPLQQKIDKLASPLQEKTNKPALPLLETTDKPASPLQEKNYKPASPLLEQTIDQPLPSSALQEESTDASTSSSELQEKTTDEPALSSVLQKKTDKPALALQEKPIDQSLSTSVLQEKTTDKPTLMLQEKTPDEPSSLLKEKNIDKTALVLQEKTTDEPQVTIEYPNECKSLVEEKNLHNPEPSDKIDSANGPNSDATPLQETTMKEPQVSLEKVFETEILVDNTPNPQPSIETPIMDTHDTNMEENVLNREPNTIISVGQPVKKSGAQELPNITDPATECKESSEDKNIPKENKDIVMEESTKLSNPLFDLSLNSDCELIDDTVLTVDLTGEDPIVQVTPLDQTNKTDKTATEGLKVDESPMEQVESSENKSVNPQVEAQNYSSDVVTDDSDVILCMYDSLQQEILIVQSNSGVELENVNEGEPKENAPFMNLQDESSQNDSTLSPHTKADQEKLDISIENSVRNETLTEQNNVEFAPEKINQNNEDLTNNVQNNLKDVPEKINQNIEEDVLMEECKTNESVNIPTVSTIEPKADQSNNAADKNKLKETTIQNKSPNKNESNRRQCSTCCKFHSEPCWHAKAPQKRDSDQLPESPAAKKQKAVSKYPADMVSLIAKHTHHPSMSASAKLQLIKECQILYLYHIPTSWSHSEMIEFMKNNVKFISETNEICCFFFFVRDAEFKHTGECLVRFKNADYCHKAWCDLRDVKIDNAPISVDLDLGHDIMRQARKDSKMRVKNLNENAAEKQKQQKSQGNENVASNSNMNKSSPVNNSFNKNAANNNAADRNSVNSPRSINSLSSSPGTSNETQNYDKNAKIFVKSKPSYMPPEKFENTTYGLNEGFLQSLGLKVPLSNVIIVLGVDFSLSDDQIKEIFSLAGTVKRAFRVMKKDGGPTMKGIVEYDHPVEAVQAISMFHGKQLHGRTLNIKMAPKAFPRPLPEGLTEVGPGLGFEGEPMRGVRAVIELQSIKKMLMDFKNTYNSKMAEMDQSTASFNKSVVLLNAEKTKMEQSIASLNKSVALLNAKKFEMEQSIVSLNKSVAILNAKKAEPAPQRKVSTPTPPAQTQPTQVATQLANALSSLAQPNVLMGLTNLTQGLAQQGLGTDQAAMANQMMLQNAGYAQNFNMQGMQQPTLPGAFPQPVVAQPGLAQPQMYYGQPQMMQPGFMAMPTVPSPAPGASVPQMNQQPSTSYSNQPQQMASQQQTHAYTPRVPENKGSSKNQTTNSNWNTAPVAAPVSQKQLEQKATEPKPAYSSESSYYKRQSRFDVKEKSKVIESESEKKNDLLVFSNLPPSVSVQALNSKMREVGDVLFGEMTGRGRALVRFKHARDAERCIKLFNRSKVDGQVITVEYF